MLIQAMVFTWYIWPCLGSVLFWLLVRRFHFSWRWTGSLLIATLPAAYLSWLIYRSESGGGDPDPLYFLQSSIAIAAAISIVTIAVLELVKIRK